MKKEVGTGIASSDTRGIDESLFGDAAVDTSAVTTEEQSSTKETKEDGQEPKNAETGDTNGMVAHGEDHATDDGETPADGESDMNRELKVVLSISEGGATIGVQRPSSDPHIESFEDNDLQGLVQEVPSVVGRARAGWEMSLKHPAYVRPAPTTGRRNRRGRGAGGSAGADAAESADSLQQALTLF